MIRKKLLTAYCLSYGNWTVIPRQWAKSFGEMSDLGFDAVALSFSESEMRYARRTFEMQIAAAHQAGIKVFVIPSRIGGRLAGAPLMGSLWLHENPSACLPENPGIACIESPEFREWSLEFIRTLIRDYEVDGIIWDATMSEAGDWRVFDHSDPTMFRVIRKTLAQSRNIDEKTRIWFNHRARTLWPADPAEQEKIAVRENVELAHEGEIVIF